MGTEMGGAKVGGGVGGVGGIFNLFDWKRKSRKKLFSNSPEGAKLVKRSEEALPSGCLHLVHDQTVTCESIRDKKKALGHGTHKMRRGICRMAFDGWCPDCKFPGDDCPLIWGSCNHAFHLHCILKSVNSQTSTPLCPMCRREWQFKG